LLQAPPTLRRINRTAGAFLGHQAALLRHPASARQRILAGLADAGLSSLAGLGAGLYAAHFLSPSVLGAYSIYFVAFLLGGYAPVMLYLLPARVALLEIDAPSRVHLMRPTLVRGAMISGVAALLTPFAGVFTLGELSATDIAPLALTAALFVLLSPLQDHMRAVFHLAAQPWRAVWVSALRLSVVVASIVTLHMSPVARQWVPFGSLALGCGVSMLLGLWLTRHDADIEIPGLEPMTSFFRSGWSLLVSTLLPLSAQFLAGGLVAAFVAVDNLGYAEASRVVAQPIHVASLGLAQALTPLLMQAAQSRSRRAIVRPRRLYLLGLFACALAYLPIVVPSPFNPLEGILPNAYHLHLLVLASVASIVVYDLSALPLSELAASKNGRLLLLPTAVASLIHLCFVAATMRALGAYAIPLGILINGTITTAWTYRRSNALLTADG
jgi:hypothetical protein